MKLYRQISRSKRAAIAIATRKDFAASVDEHMLSKIDSGCRLPRTQILALARKR